MKSEKLGRKSQSTVMLIHALSRTCKIKQCAGQERRPLTECEVKITKR